METISSIRSFVSSKISLLFNTKYHLNEKKKYLTDFFKKEDLNHITVNGFHFFVIPKQYYIWKGININNKKNQNVDINSKNTEEILKNLSSYFFADKNTASLYGTNKRHSKTKGVDLQFKIIKDLYLLDISSIDTIVSLFKYLKNIKIEELINNRYLLENYNEELEYWKQSEKLKLKYKTEEIFFEKKWKVSMLELITDTLGNYDPKYVDGKQGSPKTPTKVERKSDECIDEELVKLICNIKDIELNGWIYFKKNEIEENDQTFHDELLICNPYGYIEYVDYHKI
tara:strand:- start:4633 stop:5487 length:855 start_codon:yes stop_codon:yes gene_type:complete